ncbi:isoleucine--tRNA ligase [Rhizobium sp. MHM7A]|uniref:isoleucine--tRNA ligase n=1 Tax=Rhizobium sp. MHM7A TaxID=2583233 RepID=UPI001106CB33|nr:isoleucine--tRNA ligase [Rhizobium sp. MHM7A]TLX16149.1 isoleucine--tRNA ligase [Rhizobium sp. MHM7A]
MSQSDKSHDYAHTLALPKNLMAMKVNQPDLEKELLAGWQETNLYRHLREASAGRPKFVLHDGPPYANGNIHLGHALNKVLKDAMVRSFQMRGYDAAYVPGWDCHGLPIEWKVEEQYRNSGRSKDDVPVNEFRQECREFASHWLSVQSAEFERLGVLGDFENPYTTMKFEAEATIASELMKLVVSGQVYQGSKPVMWSVVERTALAEAEVEHQEYESDAVWVKFPVVDGGKGLDGASVVIWTTTPWTMPANRAVAYSQRVAYGLYEVVAAERDYGPRPGERFLVADALVGQLAAKGRLELSLLRSVSNEELAGLTCAHPLQGLGYDYRVPLLEADHVTDSAGTGFVHTAPGHGVDDFEVWTRNVDRLAAMGLNTRIPFTVDDGGYLTDEAPGFGPGSAEGAARVLDDAGKKGDANQRVVKALMAADALVAYGKVKHSYPHSWRSGKPVFYRNTPQWFVHMDKVLSDGRTLRARALAAVAETKFVPEGGRKRLESMVEDRPDWVLSRQRRWGVPVTVFCNALGEPLVDAEANAKVFEAFSLEGADAWFADGAKERFLGHRSDMDQWHMVTDILDVWFDSGCTHAFTTEARAELASPADVYLEGSDQHRGWFQSSLLEACATRGRAPFKVVVTHGFVLGEDGLKMAKSKNNGVSPQKVMEKHGAEVLRLWALTADYQGDVRIGANTLQSTQDAFRKVRNTLKWLTGMLPYYSGMQPSVHDLPELERLMLHRLYELDEVVRSAYDAHDFKKVVRALADFMNVELSAFYFDVRKDVLYCDPQSSQRRQASLFVMAQLFDHLTAWLAPVLPFLAEEAWLSIHKDRGSVHLRQFPVVPTAWCDEELAARWRVVMSVRSLVNACLEVERKGKRLGKALEASPVVYVADETIVHALEGLPLAEVFGTSGAVVEVGDAPDGTFVDEAMPGVAVKFRHAQGVRCARSWMITEDVGSDADYPDVSARDAKALRELAEAA